MLIDGVGQLGIVATKKDVFVGGIDVLNVGLLEDCFGFPSKRYKGDDVAQQRLSQKNGCGLVVN